MPQLVACVSQGVELGRARARATHATSEHPFELVLELGEDRVDARVAIGRIDLQPAHEDPADARGHVGGLRRGPSLALGDVADQLREVLAGEGPMAVQPLVQGDAKAEEIAAGIERLAPELLGRHIGRRPHDRAGLGHLVAVDLPRLAGGRARAGAGHDRLDLGDAEVGHPHATVVTDQDVVGLEVTVDQADAMSRGKPPPRLDELVDHRTPTAMLPVEPLAHRGTADQLHGDEDLVLVLTDLVHMHDVGVRQAGHRLGLSQHAATVARRIDQVLVDHLEGDLAL